MTDSSSNTNSNVMSLRLNRPCPQCQKPSTREFYPFCSRNCKNIDLNHWLSGNYVIPAREEDTTL